LTGHAYLRGGTHSGAVPAEVLVACVASAASSLAQGLNDSPAGLAAWIVEKLRAWSDCNGNIESRFAKDELLTEDIRTWLARFREGRYASETRPVAAEERNRAGTMTR